ncbi:MAG: hypothetical protein KI785_12370, partial [Devosiaceae bacterium]|nr:hypothetical protein [Devosiaceae bacterium MH13]
MRFRPLTKPLKAPRRARVLAAVGLLCVLFAVVFVGFGLVTLPGALVALGLASAIAALALILALYALGRIWQQPAKGALDSLLAIVWALPVIVCAGGLYYVLTQTESYPDLATDTD